MSTQWPERVIVWPEAVGGQGLGEMLRRVPARRVVWASEQQARSAWSETAAGPATGDLHLRRLRGPFLVPCPGTKEYLCCGYHVLRIGENCNLGCSYCILPAYFRGRGVSSYVNWGAMWEELGARLTGSRFTRVGTGEFTDSLSWDHVAGLAPRLVRFFSERPRGLLELKTKSIRVQELRAEAPNSGTVVSWSVNSREIAGLAEPGGAPVEESLRAARRVTGWGYGVGFHFDPLVWYPGWRAGYTAMVEQLFRHVSPSSVVWISLGALRFPRLPGWRGRTSGSLRELVAHGEWIKGADGKDRYYRPLRTEMYAEMASAIRGIAGPGVTVYLCMESAEVWRESLALEPSSSRDVTALLDRAGMTYRSGETAL